MSSTIDIVASPSLHKGNASNSLLRRAARAALGSLDSFSESMIISLLGRISRGQLRIVTPTKTYNFPLENPQPSANGTSDDASSMHVTVTVRNNAFWTRVLTTSDLGFAEAYMLSEIDVDDLSAFFKLFMYNRDELEPVSTLKSLLSYIPTFGSRKLLDLTVSLANVSNGKANVSAHYNLSNRMFEAFLSRDRTYSCGLFETLDEDLIQPPKDKPLRGLESLEKAQLRKLRLNVIKANIRDGDRVLEVGSGWGSFSIYAATLYKCTVDTLTLSEEQAAVARERIARAGLQDRVRVHVLDYRNIPAEWNGQFDRFVSIEMMEHVGAEYMETFWQVVDRALKKDGAGCVEVITLPEAQMSRYLKDVDFIRKYIFPGGFLPSANMLLNTLNSGSQSRLIVNYVSNIGPHYARTLREWQRKFLANFDSVILPQLQEQYSVSNEEVETFKRKWVYYFTFCEALFATRSIGCHVISFTREGNVELPCDVRLEEEIEEMSF
ncbi:cyclopropane-fatty-acyl-phospholipid synthase [Dacryopinax primogenitus]|uniref:Cyclopropane-fatty-acyl-phospholipid synthase n=1 Tax=Dacryopinax primogenitus (strain DJM 731) TaxID=1858805 RepID=M5FPG5_DACPD|nr:cyclopropane-fatty-acyl-phospholipid synthase [Dacryopinax primogenitus]EJT98545.1 cyclopropane-fatty-acyl-phospholipid synthase [Dacryopinax primogenitus]